MDIFTVVLYCLGAILFLSGIAAIISHLRFLEKNQRLPDACKYMDLVQKNESLKKDNQQLLEAKKELQIFATQAEEKKAWLEENQALLLSVESDRKKQEEAKSEYEGYLDKLSGLTQQVNEQQKESEKLSGQIVAADAMIQAKTGEIKEIAMSLDSMKKEKADLEAHNASLKKENETQIVENETAVRKLRELQDIVVAESDKLANITAEYTEKSDSVDKLNKQIEDGSIRLNAAKELLSQQESLIREKTVESGKLEKAVDQLSQTRDSLEADTKILKENKAEIAEHIDKLKTDCATLSTTYQEMQTSAGKLKAEIEVAEKNKEELEEKELSLAEQLDGMKKEKAELEARNASLMKENETQAVENETAVRKLRELQDMVGRESDNLANITAEYTEKKAELDSYQVRKDALVKEIDILKESIEALRKETGVKTTSNEETLKDLWEPIIFPKLAPAKKEKSEQDLLADTKNYIRGKKLYFPDRVIHAFHTSMKCNDISPITVLAGISGTGKSELPKCYAEGMGMHFSMLAVQPRWDSPQDLLGFYNYMENKYKATELARAMVRFDRFNRSYWGDIPKECDDRSDRMLLVLLDEMNLARVEYYFSEFLSKLETRRGVNLEDEKDRVKAEIELELTGRAPLRIFADRNILFTGTMNEDESTQTLSDKVLDRANVLRFGKPKSTNITEKIRNVSYVNPRSEGMTYKCWRSWCTDAKDVKMDEQVSDWINRLNNAMEDLQKPFGHRVAQAIATYVANYPKGVANGDEKKIAFADQIEQRIMPKLRGIDLDSYEEPLKKIGDLIEEMGDQTLHSAYMKSSQDANGIFLWQGIDRSEEV